MSKTKKKKKGGKQDKEKIKKTKSSNPRTKTKGRKKPEIMLIAQCNPQSAIPNARGFKCIVA
jgi:hypothetical protein